MKTKNTSLILFVLMSALPIALSAQCSDSTTTFVYTTGNVYRSSANNVVWGGTGWVTGDYYYLWTTSVTATAYVNSVQKHTSTATSSAGGTASIVWNDQPSVLGAGTYSVTDSWNYSACFNYGIGPTTSNDSIQKPTISGNNSVWYLGSGQSQTGYSYMNAMTANNNCGGSDTCNDTPSWAVTGNSSEIYLSCNPCVNQTVYAQARSNTFQDIQLTVSFGGFASDPLPFTVYAPYRITCCNYLNDAINGDGFETDVYLDIYDVFGDHLLYLAVNESFTATLIPDYSGLSGYGAPAASGVAAGWGGYSTFRDKMGASGGCLTIAVPNCTNPQSPLSSMMIFHNAQNWYAGSQNPGQGVWVREDTQQFYVDHGRYSWEYSPVYP